MQELEPLNLAGTFVALDAAAGARALPVTPVFWPALDAGALGDVTRLVSSYAFEGHWATWERHPAGEEIVLLVSGRAVLQLQEGAGPVRSVTLARAGDFVLVPPGVWHTALIDEPTVMLFVTPGEGTENRPVDVG
jgi:mannose-6-phosphate isomerase-like protein (cupin superfamily)